MHADESPILDDAPPPLPLFHVPEPPNAPLLRAAPQSEQPRLLRTTSFEAGRNRRCCQRRATSSAVPAIEIDDPSSRLPPPADPAQVLLAPLFMKLGGKRE